MVFTLDSAVEIAMQCQSWKKIASYPEMYEARTRPTKYVLTELQQRDLLYGKLEADTFLMIRIFRNRAFPRDEISILIYAIINPFDSEIKPKEAFLYRTGDVPRRADPLRELFFKAREYRCEQVLH